MPEGETATVSLLNEYTPDLVKLTVTKKVNGNMGDPSQKFAFTLEVNGETKTFTLKDGEKAASVSYTHLDVYKRQTFR